MTRLIKNPQHPDAHVCLLRENTVSLKQTGLAVPCPRPPYGDFTEPTCSLASVGDSGVYRYSSPWKVNLVESISSSILAKRLSSSHLTFLTPLSLDFYRGAGLHLVPSLQEFVGSRRGSGRPHCGWAGLGLCCHTSVFCFGTAKTLRR